MRPVTFWLSVLLLCSLGVNLWQWLNTRPVSTDILAPPQPQQSQTEHEALSNELPQSSLAHDASATAQTPLASPSHSGKLLTTLVEQNASRSTLRLIQLLHGEDYDQLAIELSDALKDDPFNIELLIIETELVLATQPLIDGLLHLNQLLDLPLTKRQSDLVTKRLNTLLWSSVSELKQALAWEALAQIMEPLFQLHPTDKGITLTLAEAYARQQKLTLMEDTLAALASDDPDAQQIRAIANPINRDTSANEWVGPEWRERQDIERIALAQMGNNYLVSVALGRNAANLILDTGASTTAISQPLFRQLMRQRQVEFIGRFDVSTAGGTIRAPLVKVATLQLGEHTLHDISAFVLPFSLMDEVDGLLGMNVLQSFDFKIDQQSSTLLIRKQ